MMVKTYSIAIDDELIKEVDVKRKEKTLSRNWIINYLLKKWLRDGCKIIIED
jgi:metal-responsive CopG/Arc/MetJ family transcriptional regulator